MLKFDLSFAGSGSCDRPSLRDE